MSNLVSLFTAADGLGITLAEAKAQLRVQHSAEDAHIEDCIKEATKYCEEVAGIKLQAQVWDYFVDSLSDKIAIPFLPANSLVSVVYYDVDNAQQTIDVSNFYLFNLDSAAYIEKKSSFSWPTIYSRRDAVRFRVNVGQVAIDVNIKKAIKLLVAHWYQNRGAAIIGTVGNPLPMGVNELLSMSRIGWSA